MRRSFARRFSATRRAAESHRRLEVLESRSVMAVTCSLADGTLTVCGTDPADQVALVAHAEGDSIHVFDANNTLVASYSSADVQQIDVQSAGGVDAVRYDAALASLINVSGASNTGVSAPARSPAPVELTHAHQHGAAEEVSTTVASEPVAKEQAKAPVVDNSSAQMLVSLPSVPTAAYSPAASVAVAPNSNVSTVTSDNSSSAHSHGSDGAQALISAPTAAATGHEAHGGTDSVIATTAATATVVSLTNPISSTAMSGGATSGGRSSSGEGAKSCELKTTFKGTSATLYTKFECKCDEKKWGGRRARGAAAANEAAKNLRTRAPLQLIWDGGHDTCSDSDHVLEEFERMQQEYADEAAESLAPVVTEPETDEAGTDFFQILGMSLLSVGVVGLAATRIPTAGKRDEEEERELFLSLELLTR